MYEEWAERAVTLGMAATMWALAAFLVAMTVAMAVTGLAAVGRSEATVWTDPDGCVYAGQNGELIPVLDDSGRHKGCKADISPEEH